MSLTLAAPPSREIDPQFARAVQIPAMPKSPSTGACRGCRCTASGAGAGGGPKVGSIVTAMIDVGDLKTAVKKLQRDSKEQLELETETQVEHALLASQIGLFIDHPCQPGRGLGVIRRTTP
jgi:hypothetical protein